MSLCLKVNDYAFRSCFSLVSKASISFETSFISSLNIYWLYSIIIIINSYILVTLIKSTHKRLYAMCVKWTKFSEIENRSLFIQLLHAVKMIKLRLCIKFVHDNCMLENEYSCHSKLLQQLRFHHHSCCCLKIIRRYYY